MSQLSTGGAVGYGFLTGVASMFGIGGLVPNPLDDLNSQIADITSQTNTYVQQSTIACLQNINIEIEKLTELVQITQKYQESLNQLNNQYLWDKQSSSSLSITLLIIIVIMILVYILFS